MSQIKLSEDAHSRVAVLFNIPATETQKATIVAVSVKWILMHGAPCDPHTREPFPYSGTHIIQ